MNTQDSMNEKKGILSDIFLQPTCEERPDRTTLAALAAISAVAMCVTSCKKEQVGVYELNEVPLVSTAAEKDKIKTNQQFVSILYTNLFQTALSGSETFELDQLFQSVGDLEISKEVLISNFFNQAGVQLPTVEEMNADIETFITDTYKRFFVRLPNEAEKAWVRNFIQSNAYMTPELVYFSFAMSNEYQFY